MHEKDEINRVLSRALKMERFGQKFFALIGELADDKETQVLFAHLALEEEAHCRMFVKELELNDGQVFQENDFEPDRVFNVGIGQIMKEGPASVLRYAMEVEQRVIDFYTVSIINISNSGIKKFLSDIIGFEEVHKRILNEKLARVSSEPIG